MEVSFNVLFPLICLITEIKSLKFYDKELIVTYLQAIIIQNQVTVVKDFIIRLHYSNTV